MRHLKFLIPALAALSPALAQAQSADVGHEIFTQYCATCHGADATGGGPLTELMIEKPADLTQLAANNAAEPGAFPMLKVIHIIDGRTGLRAHGGPMPTYGDIFMAEEMGDREKVGAVLATRGRILSLAMYLESIQK